MGATPTSSQKHAGKKNEHDSSTNIIKALELKLFDGGNSSTLIERGADHSTLRTILS